MIFPVKAQEKACVPVARIFEKTICLAEIKEKEKEKQNAPLKKQGEQQALKDEETLKGSAIERLQNIIWRKALEHKFGKESLAPTKKEILLYSEAFKDSLKKSDEENKKSAAKIKKLLAEKKYNPDKEIKLRNLLASIETSIAFYQKRQNYNKDMPPEYYAMISKTQRSIAKAMIKDWKMNQRLYQEYGGRLSFQQGILTPVDAYGEFMTYIRNEGKLVITDTAYSAVFKVMERNIKAPLNIIPESETEIYDNYFSTPEWKFKMERFQ